MGNTRQHPPNGQKKAHARGAISGSRGTGGGGATVQRIGPTMNPQRTGGGRALGSGRARGRGVAIMEWRGALPAGSFLPLLGGSFLTPRERISPKKRPCTATPDPPGSGPVPFFFPRHNPLDSCYISDHFRLIFRQNHHHDYV